MTREELIAQFTCSALTGLCISYQKGHLKPSEVATYAASLGAETYKQYLLLVDSAFDNMEEGI